jgi:Tfp pilus assembly protein PilZ
MSPSNAGRGKRTGLRIPVSFDVKCELPGAQIFMAKAVNMSTAGMFISTSENISIEASVGLEFLLPETLNSIQVQGQSVWSCKVEEDQRQGTGIKFVNLGDPYLNMIRDYSLTKLYDDNFVKQEGILQLLDDIRNLPPEWRLKAYHILIKKGSRHLPAD